MKLSDLRRLSIKQQYRIHFRLKNGMECIVDEHGVARVPSLAGVPDFNIETELGSAAEFLMEPAMPASSRDGPRPRTIRREELAAMAGSPSAAVHTDHEEE